MPEEPNYQINPNEVIRIAPLDMSDPFDDALSAAYYKKLQEGQTRILNDNSINS